MILTLTYTDLIAAAQAHINKMGVTGEVVDVDLKVGRKDRTKTTMTITVGTAEAKQQALETPAEVEPVVETQAEQEEPTEEVVVEDVEVGPVAETEERVDEEPAPRVGLFRGIN